MGIIINARVKQKTGAVEDFAGWVLKEGEMALVQTAPDGFIYNFKVCPRGNGPRNFDDLPWSLQSPGAAQAVTPGFTFPEGTAMLAIPTANGTYAGVIVDTSETGADYGTIVQIIWDGTTATKVNFPIPVTGLLPSAGYPGTAADLDAARQALQDKLVVTPEASGNQLFDKVGMINSVDLVINGSGGTVVNPGGVIVKIPISDAFAQITVSGVVGLGVTGAKYWRFRDAALNILGADIVQLTPTQTFTVPSGAAWFYGSPKRSDTVSGQADPATALDAVMVNYGDTALPFEPYGGSDFLATYDGNDIKASLLAPNATMQIAGETESSVQNKAGVKKVVSELPVRSNLSAIDRWLNGVILLNNATSLRFTEGIDGWFPNPALTYSAISAKTDFDYDGNMVQVVATAIPNFYYYITKEKLMAGPGFTGQLYAALEAICSGTYDVDVRVWRVTGTNTETLIYTKTVNFIAGVKQVVTIDGFDLLGGLDPSTVRGIQIRFHAITPNTWVSATFKIGRLNVSTIPTTLVEEKSDFPAIVRKFSGSGITSKKGIVNALYEWLNGKKWTVDGDSIDFGTGSTGLVGYKDIVAGYFGLTYTTCAVGGTTMGGSAANAMWQDARVNTIPLDTDILTIKAGTNDIAAASVTPLGTLDNETDTNTFYGAWQVYLTKVRTRIPNAEIVVMTFPYKNFPPYLANGVPFESYRQAIRDIGRKYGYLVADIGAECGINRLNTSSYLPDNTHPNDAGYERISRVIINTFKKVKP